MIHGRNLYITKNKSHRTNTIADMEEKENEYGADKITI